jgi:hypothetical protein
MVLLFGAPGAFAEVDNVAFQWTNLLNQLWCTAANGAIFTSSIQPQLHLAQWHALVALKSTGDCTLEEAAVAYASHKILSHFFAWAQDGAISPLLDSQLRTMSLSTKQKRLSKRLGEAVATNIIQKRSPGNEFTLGAVKDAVSANTNPALGVFRYFNGTPPANQIFVFNNIALEKPFVIPDPIQFVKDHLSNLKPMTIPSKEWDENWKGLRDIGRAGWPGRTSDMNLTAYLYGCAKINHTICSREQVATASAQSALPNTTSLYDSVTLLAKISVSLYDAVIAHIAIKYGYWFWRPIHAYPAGDPQHAPIPDWKPYRGTPPEPEYPSGTVTAVASGARPLYNFFGHKDVPFTIKGGGVFNCEAFVGVPVPDRHYGSVDDLVAEAKLARLYAGAHWQKSVDDAVIVANTVADYVEKHWTDTAPSGVLPDPAYLDVFARVPKKSGEYSPVRFDI